MATSRRLGKWTLDQLAGGSNTACSRWLEIQEGSDSEARPDLRLVRAEFMKPRRGYLQSFLTGSVCCARLMIPPRQTKVEVLETLKSLTKIIDGYWAAIVKHPEEITTIVSLSRTEIYKTAEPAPAVDETDPDTWPADRRAKAEGAFEAAAVMHFVLDSRQEREHCVKKVDEG